MNFNKLLLATVETYSFLANDSSFPPDHLLASRKNQIE